MRTLLACSLLVATAPLLACRTRSVDAPAPRDASARTALATPATPAPVVPPFGPLTLAPGFAPDPALRHGLGGGARHAALRCDGAPLDLWLAFERDQSLTLTAAVPHLRVALTTLQPAALVLVPRDAEPGDPSGRCARTAEHGPSFTVSLALEALTPGHYDLYIASPTAGLPTYTLAFATSTRADIAPEAPPPVPLGAGTVAARWVLSRENSCAQGGACGRAALVLRGAVERVIATPAPLLHDDRCRAVTAGPAAEGAPGFVLQCDEGPASVTLAVVAAAHATRTRYQLVLHTGAANATRPLNTVELPANTRLVADPRGVFTRE